MPVLKKLKDALEKAGVSYEIFNHPLAYTAQEIAARQHFSGDEMAKVVMLEVDGKLVMGVIPASRRMDLHLAMTTLGTKAVRLASEEEFAAKFPGCEIGAMPPFGNLFGIPVVVDPALEKDEYIYFNAGSHVQTIRMTYSDYARLVGPRVVRLVAGRKRAAA
jgi:Ala-tRNA(Pro) deacylase